jgi:hypothetical protein
VHVQGALSSGEGRNTQQSLEGLAFTLRGELLPFGQFTRGGDYFEGDLEHEKTPKLSLGLTWSRNDDAVRTGGQLGAPLWEPRTMTTWYADGLLKYQGLAVYGEYAKRDADDPVTFRDGQSPRFVFVGDGALLQASYHIKGLNVEPGARVAFTDPASSLTDVVSADRTWQYDFVLVRYWKRHRVKTQAEFGWFDFTELPSGETRREWLMRVGAEVGI